MGIIKAVRGSVKGTIAGVIGDQWLETIEPEKISNQVIASYGVQVRKNDKRNSNKKGTSNLVSNGSIIHVPENVVMLLVDGGKIISVAEESGYYEVKDSVSPSIFFQPKDENNSKEFENEDKNIIERLGLMDTLKDSFERFKFGGNTPRKQQVIYINKQEIIGIRFGTKNPVPYTDRVLVPGRVVPCKVTSFGEYSIKISDPILFYREVCSKTGNDAIEINDLGSQYIGEFLGAYSTALARLSIENIMVTDIPIRQQELANYMADALDDKWLTRGILIHSVAITNINFDDKTNELLERYGNDSILLDPNARAARIAGGYAAGMEAAGSNAGGSMMGFAGMSMGMNAGMGMGVNSNQGMQGQQPYQQYNQQAPSPSSNTNSGNKWTCACGNTIPEDAKFCTNCGGKKPIEEGSWKCLCGNVNTSKFCSNCGNKKPESISKIKCSNCGFEPQAPNNTPKFCPECGNKLNQ